MTLAVTVVCQDGVVVAADSRTTLGNHRMLRVGSDFTHKVFASGEVAVATYGEAFVDDRSIASHMAEFAAVEAGNCAHPGPVAERPPSQTRKFVCWKSTPSYIPSGAPTSPRESVAVMCGSLRPPTALPSVSRTAWRYGWPKTTDSVGASSM